MESQCPLLCRNRQEMWSVGEFAPELRDIFLPQSATRFRFIGEHKLRSTPALIFDFKVERTNNHLWRLDSGEESTFPGYHGRLWIRKSNFQLMRLERQVDDAEAHFPMREASTLIDYSDIALADGTSFVLPVQPFDLYCSSSKARNCWHDQLTFKHWQKFAARAHVLQQVQ